MYSLCTRCGKERIFKKQWEEKVGQAPPITHVLTVCPDKECQKILDAENKAKEEKKLLLKTKKTPVAT